MSAIPVTVHGAEGRMGRLVTELVEQTDGLELAGLITEVGRGREAGDFHARMPLTPQDRLTDIHPAGGVIVDFSLAPALDGLLVAAAELNAALVVGTTGHSDQQMNDLAAYAADHCVVMASNFSQGVPVLKMLLEHLAGILPGSFQPEQVEIHHEHKIDRPSGTARTLATGWTRARGGEEPPTHSLRIGGVIGEHRWVFADEEETIEITHRAHSRKAFMRGLGPAIRFAATGPAGLRGMEDVLTLGGNR